MNATLPYFGNDPGRAHVEISVRRCNQHIHHRNRLTRTVQDNPLKNMARLLTVDKQVSKPINFTPSQKEIST